MTNRLLVAGMLGALLCAVTVALIFGSAAASIDEARIIADATANAMTATSGTIFEASCATSLEYDAQVIDLDADGQPEVFTQIYGTCLGGGAGVSVDLYIRDASGQWHSQFGFPGVYSVLETKTLGYPDIMIGGPGNCFPVWRWGGAIYELAESCPGL